MWAGLELFCHILVPWRQEKKDKMCSQEGALGTERNWLWPLRLSLTCDGASREWQALHTLFLSFSRAVVLGLALGWRAGSSLFDGMLHLATKAAILAKHIRITEKDTGTSKSMQMYVRTFKSCKREYGKRTNRDGDGREHIKKREYEVLIHYTIDLHQKLCWSQRGVDVFCIRLPHP